MRLDTGSWKHSFAFAGLALTPAALTALLSVAGLEPKAADPPPLRPAAAFVLESPQEAVQEAPLVQAALPAQPATPLPDRLPPIASDVPELAEPAVLSDAAAKPEVEDGAVGPMPAEEPPPATERRAEGRLKRGQTIGQALRGHGINSGQVHELVSSLRPLYDFRRAPAGAAYDLAWSAEGDRLARFCFRPSPLKSYEATRSEDGGLSVRAVEPEFRVVEAEVAARIDGSLYQAIAEAGESPLLASKIADVFAWDLDFSRDQQRGDTFRMIVEKRYVDGEFIDYGRVLAAQYEGRRGSHRAFWFSAEGPDGPGRYYLPDGRSAEKTFLATPVEFTRVSSRFSRSRRHPILGFNKAHNGTDFAAPRGTPVRAMADGVVVFSGRKGPSGKLVILEHRNGFRTYYAHLDSFASGLRKGRRVQQKELIGRVGTTGRSTGPHLHLGVKRNGRWVDPQRLKIQRTDPLPPAQLPAFQAYSAAQLARLEALDAPEDGPPFVREREQRLAALQLAALSSAGGI